MNNEKYTAVTLPPPDSQDLQKLLGDFLKLAGLTQQEYVDLTESLTEGDTPCGPITLSAFKSYKNHLPSPPNKRTIIFMFEAICDESVKKQWIDSFITLENQIRNERNDTKSSKEHINTDLEAIKEPNKQEAQELESNEKKTSKFYRYKSTFSSKSLLLIFILLLIFFLLLLVIINNERKSSDSSLSSSPPINIHNNSYIAIQQIEKNNDDSPIKEFIVTPSKNYFAAPTQVSLKKGSVTQDTTIGNSESSVQASIKKETGSQESIKDNTKSHEALTEGLLLDVYSLGKNIYKPLPPTPKGLNVASFGFKSDGDFTLIDHIKNDNIFNSTIDRDVGLHYQGLINLKGSGEFIFQLNYQSGSHAINQTLKKCRLVLKINHSTIFDKIVPIGRLQSDKVQEKAVFSEGLNPFSFWFTCPNLRSFWPKQDYKAYKDTTVTLYMKQPDESEMSKIPADRFSYSLDAVEQ